MGLSARRMWLALVVAGAALALAEDVPTSPALHCPADATRDRCRKHSSTRFRVNGFSVDFAYEVNNSIRLKCLNFLQLDSVRVSPWLPRFTPALHVGNVTVVSCPPLNYATVLAALNVTPTPPFNLEVSGMREITIQAAHFADLPPLRHLTLRYAGVLHSLPASMEGLTTLTIERTSLLNDTILEALPRTLTEIRLERVKITRVPAAVLELPELRSLHVDFFLLLAKPNVSVVERSNTSRLRQLYVSGADAALLSEWAPPVLEKVTLKYWQAENPNPLPACDKLMNLTLHYPHVRSLPAGWVARCLHLEELHITGASKLSELPARLLENATQLTNIEIQGTSLTSLPTQLFADTPHLSHLDLSNNHLHELPSSMLTLPLLSLDLGINELNTRVVAKLATFTELRNLSLAWNPMVGDLCPPNSNVPEYKFKSPLVSLSKLERLNLRETNVSVICSDWREDMVDLKYLDLSYTKIHNVTYEDLQYKRNVPAMVKLAGTVYFTADDYDRAAETAAVAPPSRDVTLRFMKTSYDCSVYWLTEALNGGLLPLYDVHIYYEPPLRTVRAEDLLCDRNETCAAVPSDCDCGMAGGGLLRVVCDGAELDRVPRLPSLDNDTDVQAVDLLLSNNSITELGVDDLPPHLRVLDLRNNSISYMTEATAHALVSGTKRRVLLAGNRLDCSCRATPALRVLRDHATVLVGYAALRCEDGGTLQDAVDACSTFALR